MTIKNTMNEDFARVNKIIMDALERGVKTACIVVQADAVDLAPFDLGNLKNSIDNYTERDVDEVRGYVGTNAEYAPYQEFGTGIHAEDGKGRKTPWAYEDSKGNVIWTHGNKPHSFLRPALKMNYDNIKKIIAKSIRMAT